MNVRELFQVRLISSVLFLCCVGQVVSASIVTPEMFGAKCDGVNDDTKYFEKAIESGNDIYLNGVYLISDIRLSRNQRMYGAEGAKLLYNSLILSDGCIIKNIVFDGQWETNGVTILGSNVSVEGCTFMHTKNTMRNYGGLTSAIWIGHYSDLKESSLKHFNIQIKNCVFDGCEPYDTESRVSENKSVARCILSYGCDNLVITGCVFKNLRGYYDSDYIHLRSFETKCLEFPFYDDNPSWVGNSPPFTGTCYSDASTIINNCVFYQDGCKSSIKVMSDKIQIEKNKFIVNNALNEDSYSVIRLHRTRNVLIKKNVISVDTGGVNHVLIISNSHNAQVSKNKVICGHDSYVDSFLALTYTNDCTIINNHFESYWAWPLLCTEYNHSLSIKRNSFIERHQYDDSLNLFFQQSNHYAYPSILKGSVVLEKNNITIPSSNRELILLNRYDYQVDYKKNKIKIIP